MCRVIAVTNRKLVAEGAFLQQIERLAGSGAEAIILREKDLSEEEYKQLAQEVLAICRREKKICILHNFVRAAAELGEDKIHLPLPRFLELKEKSPELLKPFHVIGTSVHSTEEAECACRLGASYLAAGHIFPTDCKAGLAARGTEFLEQVCLVAGNWQIPVLGIGGINQNNIHRILSTGAVAGCVMSEAMKEKLWF